MTVPPGLRDDNDKSMHRGKRQIFDIINLIFGITGTALGGYNTAQIAALQSRQSEIVQHINQIVTAVNSEHNDLVAFAESDHSLYEYTHKEVQRAAEQAQEIECRLVEEGAVLLAISERQRILTRAYVDLSSAVVSLFNGKLSPALLPLRQVVRLLETDRNFKQTIYWDNPTDLYQLATVHPVYPLRQHAIGYVLRIPRIMRAELAPLYCVTAVGVLSNDRKYALRPKLPTHLVYDSVGIGTDCDRLRYRVRIPQALATDADEYSKCLRDGFRVPELNSCKQLEDSVYLCPHQYAVRRSTCLTNISQCSWETKTHSDTEMVAGRYAYAIRTTEQSCYAKQLQEQPIKRIPAQGFLSEPYRRTGLISCGPISYPLKPVEFRYQFDYKEEKAFTPPVLQTKVITDEWTGQRDLENIIETMQNRPLLSVLGTDFSTSQVTISIAIVVVLVIVIAVVAIIIFCYYKKKTTQQQADVVADEIRPKGNPKVTTVCHGARKPRYTRIRRLVYKHHVSHKKARDRHETTKQHEPSDNEFAITDDSKSGSCDSPTEQTASVVANIMKTSEVTEQLTAADNPPTSSENETKKLYPKITNLSETGLDF